jgi:hypothetical protein
MLILNVVYYINSYLYFNYYNPIYGVINMGFKFRDPKFPVCCGLLANVTHPWSPWRRQRKILSNLGGLEAISAIRNIEIVAKVL